MKSMPPFVDLIWNMTLVCPFDCAVCCVDAVHVRRRAGRVELRSEAGRHVLERDPAEGSIYEQAGRFRQRQGLELDLTGKMRVLDHLEGLTPRIDFSGGDVLVMPEHLEVIGEAAARYGRETITITATSAGVGESEIAVLPAIIGHFNFTFDGQSSAVGGNRPPSYASANLRAGRRLAEAGVSVRAELPLTRSNIADDELTRIYEELGDSGVGQILAMRLFPVGRGKDRSDQVPSPSEYLQAIKHLRKLEGPGRPKVRLQCALRHLEASGGPNPCNAVTASFGIAPDGTLLRSAWAIDRRGKPLDPSWVLGNVAHTPLREILETPPVREMRERADENHGHCKVFAFLNGTSPDPADRFYERSDPLYATGPRGKGETESSSETYCVTT